MPSGEVTRLLQEWREGDERALDALMPLVYTHLRQIARGYLSSERHKTLQATALVHEAYLQLVGAEIAWQNRTHLLAVLARTMRRVLVDHARSHLRDKRGGDARHVTLDEVAAVGGEPSPEIVDIDEALDELSRQDVRKAKLIEMLYFGGLTVPEAAEALGISAPTAHRDARLARAWIRHRLESHSVG